VYFGVFGVKVTSGTWCGKQIRNIAYSEIPNGILLLTC